MSLQHSAFDQLAKLVTAADLQSPLLPPAQESANAYEAMLDASNEDIDDYDYIALVKSGETPVGWWAPFEAEVDANSPRTVAQVMDPIPLSMVISSDASYYALADAFARRRHPFFLVLDGVEIAGWVSYHNLFSRVGQMCLLSLTLYLEAVSEDLCVSQARDCWAALSPGRKAKARAVYAARHQKPRTRERDEDARRAQLIRCTTFIDKSTMLSRVGLVDGMGKRALQHAFSTAESVRNLCAHGGGVQEFLGILPQKEFSDFLHRTLDIIRLVHLRTQERRH